MNQAAEKPVTILSPQPEGVWKHMLALWQSRRLIYWLARRDLTLRYRQTLMGFLWVLLYPATLFGVYLFSLGYLAKLPLPQGVPYSIYILTGLVPWIYFQTTLIMTSSAMQQNMHLISKVYFPRFALIIAAYVTASFDFLWMLIMLILVTSFFFEMPGIMDILIILFWSLIAGILGMAIGTLISVISIHYRDLHIALPVMLQVGFFLSPVVYATHLVPQKYLNWYYYNPLTTIIESMRKGFNLDNIVSTSHQIMAITFCMLVLVFSLYMFRKLERELVDRM